MNSSGKVLTVFFVIMAILLVSLAATSLFFFNNEIEKRKEKEAIIKKMEVSLSKSEKKIADLDKEKAILIDKNKEADDRVESLLGDIDLEKSVKEEIKSENVKLKANVKKIEEEKKELQITINNNSDEKKKIEQELQKTKKSLADVEKQLEAQKQKADQASSEKPKATDEQPTDAMKDETGTEKMSSTDAATKPAEKGSITDSKVAQGVELEPIIVMPDEEIAPITVIPDTIPEGRILTVDADTDFVIINLGAKDGIKAGYVLSVSRGKKYLGDIKVTRVHPEMSAADIIPPFTGKMTRKNDQVSVKK